MIRYIRDTMSPVSFLCLHSIKGAKTKKKKKGLSFEKKIENEKCGNIMSPVNFISVHEKK